MGTMAKVEGSREAGERADHPTAMRLYRYDSISQSGGSSALPGATAALEAASGFVVSFAFASADVVS